MCTIPGFGKASCSKLGFKSLGSTVWLDFVEICCLIRMGLERKMCPAAFSKSEELGVRLN